MLKHRITAGILALCMSVSVFWSGAYAQSVEDYPALSSNFNTDAVYNGPDVYAKFNVPQNLRIDALTIYHWNNGRGSVPGTISLYDSATQSELYTWQAYGRSNNTYWDCFPGVYLPPGSYYVKDSDWATASYNSKSPGGMVELRGEWVNDIPQGLTDSQEPPVTTDNDGLPYTFSDWAKSDIKKAEAAGIIPSSLYGDDLRRPISRGIFASIAVNVYEEMSGDTLSAGSNPFSDSSAEDVLKAYNADIVAGTSATTFSPNNSLTREQAAAMLARAYKKTVFEDWSLSNDYELQYNSTSAFSDYGDIRPYARESVGFMAANGVITGMGNNMFVPEGTLTKEQAIAIAVRMTEKLDTTRRTGKKAEPQQPVQSGGDVILTPATKIEWGSVKIDFNGGGSGDALLVKGDKDDPDSLSDTYHMVTEKQPSKPVTITLPCDAPGSRDAFIAVGIPYTLNGGRDIHYLDTLFPADFSNGTASATIDFEQFPSDFMSGVQAEANNFGAETAMKEAADELINVTEVTKEVGAHHAPRGWGDTGYYKVKVIVGYNITVSDCDHFKLYMPAQHFTTKEECAEIIRICEDTLSDYKDKYSFNYSEMTHWPIPLIPIGANNAGAFLASPSLAYSKMYLNFGRVKSQGYNKENAELCGTIAHELQHFIQRCKCSHASALIMRSTWIDEIMAVYYEWALCPKSTSPYIEENAAINQFDGMIPSGNSANDGYARRPLGEYIVYKNGGNEKAGPNVMKIYSDIAGGTLSGTAVVNALGGDEAAAVREYYKMIFKEELKSVEMSTTEKICGPVCEKFRQEAVLTSSVQEIPMSTKARGVRFLLLDTKNIRADITSLNISNDAGMDMYIHNARNRSMPADNLYESTGGAAVNVPVKRGLMYIAVVNHTDSNSNITVKVETGSRKQPEMISSGLTADKETVFDGTLNMAKDDISSKAYITLNSDTNTASVSIPGNGSVSYSGSGWSYDSEEKLFRSGEGTMWIGPSGEVRIHIKASEGIKLVYEGKRVSNTEPGGDSGDPNNPFSDVERDLSNTSGGSSGGSSSGSSLETATLD